MKKLNFSSHKLFNYSPMVLLTMMISLPSIGQDSYLPEEIGYTTEVQSQTVAETIPANSQIDLRAIGSRKMSQIEAEINLGRNEIKRIDKEISKILEENKLDQTSRIQAQVDLVLKTANKVKAYASQASDSEELDSVELSYVQSISEDLKLELNPIIKKLKTINETQLSKKNSEELIKKLELALEELKNSTESEVSETIALVEKKASEVELIAEPEEKVIEVEAISEDKQRISDLEKAISDLKQEKSEVVREIAKEEDCHLTEKVNSVTAQIEQLSNNFLQSQQMINQMQQTQEMLRGMLQAQMNTTYIASGNYPQFPQQAPYYPMPQQSPIIIMGQNPTPNHSNHFDQNQGSFNGLAGQGIFMPQNFQNQMDPRFWTSPVLTSPLGTADFSYNFNSPINPMMMNPFTVNPMMANPHMFTQPGFSINNQNRSAFGSIMGREPFMF